MYAAIELSSFAVKNAIASGSTPCTTVITACTAYSAGDTRQFINTTRQIVRAKFPVSPSALLTFVIISTLAQ